jgi:hypothetical protein
MMANSGYLGGNISWERRYQMLIRYIRPRQCLGSGPWRSKPVSVRSNPLCSLAIALVLLALRAMDPEDPREPREQLRCHVNSAETIDRSA